MLKQGTRILLPTDYRLSVNGILHKIKKGETIRTSVYTIVSENGFSGEQNRIQLKRKGLNGWDTYKKDIEKKLKLLKTN